MSAVAWSLVVSLAIAAQATLLALVNLRRYRRARPAAPRTTPTSISVCIPARNEEANIEACLRSLREAGADERLEVEFLVYDDQSTDATPAILARIAAEEPRLRRVPTVPLPEGWNGKQHACWRMAQEARGRWLLFTDADVRFAPSALTRSIAEAEASRVALLSTVPLQRIGSFAEGLLVPLIHVLLLSYLPFGRMRGTRDPAASAGCGQFLLVDAEAYWTCAGHRAFRASMHDGIRMPRLLRQHGFRTDLFDGSDVASCRMYRGWSSTWHGFAKNAYEGLGGPALLVLLSVLHLIGHVWPWVAVTLAAVGGDALVVGGVDRLAVTWALAAIVVALVGRLAMALRFGQPLWIVPFHPLAILAMTAVQWHSALLAWTGRRAWKGRTAPSVAGSFVSGDE